MTDVRREFIKYTEEVSRKLLIIGLCFQSIEKRMNRDKLKSQLYLLIEISLKLLNQPTKISPNFRTILRKMRSIKIKVIPWLTMTKKFATKYKIMVHISAKKIEMSLKILSDFWSQVLKNQSLNLSESPLSTTPQFSNQSENNHPSKLINKYSKQAWEVSQARPILIQVSQSSLTKTTKINLVSVS